MFFAIYEFKQLSMPYLVREMCERLGVGLRCGTQHKHRRRGQLRRHVVYGIKTVVRNAKNFGAIFK